MLNTISPEEDSLIEYRRTKSVKILLQKIELEHAIRVRNALDYIAQKLRITSETETTK